MKFPNLIDPTVNAARKLAVAGTRASRDIARLTRRTVLAAWRSKMLRRLIRPIGPLTRIAAVAALLSVVTVGALRATTQTILPTEIGVLQKNWGSDAGVVAEDLAPSKRFVIPGRESLIRIDGRTHFVRFGMQSEGNFSPSLELRTPDDLEISLGVTVAYRIKQGSAHKLVQDGTRATFPSLAKAAIERVLQDELAALSRDEWANVDARDLAEARSLSAIGVALEPFHLEARGVHISSMWFPAAFEVELMEQKLLEQRILTDAMLARRDERNYELLVEREDVEQAESAVAADLDFALEEERLSLIGEVLEIDRASSRYSFEKKTESDNTYEKSLAKGRLAIAKAEAVRERLIGEALESEGGRLMLARDAATNLSFKSVTLDANNPNVPSVLDLDALSRLLVGGSE